MLLKAGCWGPVSTSIDTVVTHAHAPRHLAGELHAQRHRLARRDRRAEIRGVARHVLEVGFGHIVGSEIEAPDVLANLV